jgi:opacity protein-like surface antigen
MKKYLLLILFIYYAFPASSQGFRGKLVGGLNASQVDGDGMSGFHKPGLVLGGAAEFRLSDRWSFQPEILYSQKGSRTSPNALEKDPYLVRQIFRFNYVDVPVIFNLNQFKDLTFQFGPSVAVLIAAKYDDGSGFYSIDERLNRLDFMANAGAEYRLTPRLNFNIRYNYSLWPIGSEPVTNIWVARGRNNTLSFTLRYNLNVQSE